MNFDIINAGVHFSKRGDEPGSISLNYGVVPQGSYRLEIEEGYIVCSDNSIGLYGKGRESICVKINVSKQLDVLQRFSGEQPYCGVATFMPARGDIFSSHPASLILTLYVDPEVFAELLQARISRPGAATGWAIIEGLSYGGAPDGSHQIWSLDEPANGRHRIISDFKFDFETSRCSEREIRDESDRSYRESLANSADPNDRKLATDMVTNELADPVVKLLRQCRALLAAILIVGALVLLRASH